MRASAWRAELLAERRGPPGHGDSDNGTEQASQAVLAWVRIPGANGTPSPC